MGGYSFAATVVDTQLVDDMIEIIDTELEKLESSVDQELVDAVTLLHEHEITKFAEVADFMPQNNIRRDEAAKMYVNFAKNVLADNAQVTQNPSCIFTDLHLGHSDLPPLMTESCNRGLFKGHLGAFMPTDAITNAQAVIVLVRMIDGTKIEPTDIHYATNYMTTAEEMLLLEGMNITNISARDQPATRATIAKLLYRASKK